MNKAGVVHPPLPPPALCCPWQHTHTPGCVPTPYGHHSTNGTKICGNFNDNHNNNQTTVRRAAVKHRMNVSEVRMVKTCEQVSVG